MATADGLRARLEAAPTLAPVSVVRVEDVTGGGGCGAKFDVLVVSPAFAGVALLDRHRRVQSALGDDLKAIHAITIKAYTPEVWETKQRQAAEAAAGGGGGTA